MLERISHPVSQGHFRQSLNSVEFDLCDPTSSHPRDQQPRQIDEIILVTFASSRSIAGLVPSSGPFFWPLLKPLDDSAVPNELVPGALTRSPEAPPLPMEEAEE